MRRSLRVSITFHNLRNNSKLTCCERREVLLVSTLVLFRTKHILMINMKCETKAFVFVILSQFVQLPGYFSIMMKELVLQQLQQAQSEKLGRKNTYDYFHLFFNYYYE